VGIAHPQIGNYLRLGGETEEEKVKKLVEAFLTAQNE
jgi:hypothetical protein